MSEELKPCPFCGGCARIIFSGNRISYWKGYIIAKCQTCGATSKGQFYQGEEIELPLQDTVGGEIATELWNRRTTNETKNIHC